MSPARITRAPGPSGGPRDPARLGGRDASPVPERRVLENEGQPCAGAERGHHALSARAPTTTRLTCDGLRRLPSASMTGLEKRPARHAVKDLRGIDDRMREPTPAARITALGVAASLVAGAPGYLRGLASQALCPSSQYRSPEPLSGLKSKLTTPAAPEIRACPAPGRNRGRAGPGCGYAGPPRSPCGDG